MSSSSSDAEVAALRRPGLKVGPTVGRRLLVGAAPEPLLAKDVFGTTPLLWELPTAERARLPVPARGEAAPPAEAPEATAAA
jgi:hypothetical protein